MVLGIWDIS